MTTVHVLVPRPFSGARLEQWAETTLGGWTCYEARGGWVDPTGRRHVDAHQVYVLCGLTDVQLVTLDAMLAGLAGEWGEQEVFRIAYRADACGVKARPFQLPIGGMPPCLT